MSAFVDRDAPRQGAPEGTYAFIQWKGTDVCMDVQCVCGDYCHFDGAFAYVVECPCGRRWEMPHYIIPREFVPEDHPPHNQPPIKLLDCS